MFNFPPWYSLLQSIENSLQSQLYKSNQPIPIGWNFPKQTQVSVSTSVNNNYNYQMIAKDFIEKYVVANILGIACIGHYYNNNSYISLHIHHPPNSILYEIIGHNNFKNKMSELGISIIKYNNLTYTAQPIGKSSVIITLHGKAEINNINYNILSTFIVKIISDVPRIINQILEIYI